MENNKYKEVFLELIDKGNTAAKAIVEPDKKAMAYAELAKALGMSGLLNHGFVTIDAVNTDQTVEPVQEDTVTASKESIKKGAGKKKATAKKKDEEKKAAPVPAPTEEVKEEAPLPVPEEEKAEAAGDEWTPEKEKELESELGDLDWYVQSWGEDYVYNQCVPAFFEEATIVGAEHIRPSNILAFITYLYEISQSEGTEE